MKKILTYIAIALILVGIGYFISYLVNRSEINRISNNMSSQIIGLRYSLDSMRTDVKPLMLTVNDIKEAFPELKEELKREFDIKLKNARLITHTVIENRTNFKTVVRDSMLYDTKVAEIAEYHSPWTDFNWFKPFDSDTAIVKCYSIDSITGVLHKKPRGFFGWLTGKPKQFYHTLKNKNPNNRIIYNQVIQVQ